jgi:hypothetical protein
VHLVFGHVGGGNDHVYLIHHSLFIPPPKIKVNPKDINGLAR